MEEEKAINHVCEAQGKNGLHLCVSQQTDTGLHGEQCEMKLKRAPGIDCGVKFILDVVGMLRDIWQVIDSDSVSVFSSVK